MLTTQSELSSIAPGVSIASDPKSHGAFLLQGVSPPRHGIDLQRRNCPVGEIGQLIVERCDQKELFSHVRILDLACHGSDGLRFLPAI